MDHHEHEHEHEHEEETYGLALGFRILEIGGEYYLAEAEIAPYVDAPDELGATLVFHPLDGINPVESNEDVDWPAWPIDIDDELTRPTDAPMTAQFAAIVRQLHGLSDAELKGYLEQAREEAESAE